MNWKCRWKIAGRAKRSSQPRGKWGQSQGISAKNREVSGGLGSKGGLVRDAVEHP